MRSQRKKPSAIPTVKNYDRKKKTTRVEQDDEGTVNGSPIPLPDKKAVEASKRRIPGEPPAESDQKLNTVEKRPGDRSENFERSA